MLSDYLRVINTAHGWKIISSPNLYARLTIWHIFEYGLSVFSKIQDWNERDKRWDPYRNPPLSLGFVNDTTTICKLESWNRIKVIFVAINFIGAIELETGLVFSCYWYSIFFSPATLHFVCLFILGGDIIPLRSYYSTALMTVSVCSAVHNSNCNFFQTMGLKFDNALQWTLMNSVELFALVHENTLDWLYGTAIMSIIYFLNVCGGVANYIHIFGWKSIRHQYGEHDFTIKEVPLVSCLGSSMLKTQANKI